MIDKLDRKLYIIFVSSIMLIITIVICIIQGNNINIERITDKSVFQRLTTVMIYQINDINEDFASLFKSYEEQYDYLCLLKDEDGSLLYQSDSKSLYPTDETILWEKLQDIIKFKFSTSYKNNSLVTEQNGIFLFEGTNKDDYMGISSKIVLADDKYVELYVICEQAAVSVLVMKHLHFYLITWIISFLSILIICRFLIYKAIEPVKRTLSSQKSFVASASHELKSPLAVISANTELIGNLDINHPPITAPLKKIDSECQRMSHLVQDMLTLSSSDAKTWTLCKNTINIDTLLITLYETYEPLCREKNITLDLNLSDTSYPSIDTDQERLLQILGIFMDNAIYYSNIKSSIQIQSEVEKNYITFLVVDHGKGILEADKPFIFDRFYCADKSRTEKTHFGLGLSIAAEFTKILKGSIGFKNTKKGGSTFYITIPIR